MRTKLKIIKGLGILEGLIVAQLVRAKILQ